MTKRAVRDSRRGLLAKVVEWPMPLRLLLCQASCFGLLLILAFVLPRTMRPPLWMWPLFQGLLAGIYGLRWGIRGPWLLFQILLPWPFFWQLGIHVPGWIYPVLLLVSLLIFGGGILTRVPLYHSNRAAWEGLRGLIPEGQPVSLVDLGAGFGGPLAFLAKQCPQVRLMGVEASPLVWLVARLRTWHVRDRCGMRLGSLWNTDLQGFYFVYAFLSPAPMLDLWAKARAEMAPGSLLVSNTFSIPGVKAEACIPLAGRRDACLWLYRIPGVRSQAEPPSVETNRGDGQCS